MRGKGREVLSTGLVQLGCTVGAPCHSASRTTRISTSDGRSHCSCDEAPGRPGFLEIRAHRLCCGCQVVVPLHQVIDAFYGMHDRRVIPTSEHLPDCREGVGSAMFGEPHNQHPWPCL